MQLHKRPERTLNSQRNAGLKRRSTTNVPNLVFEYLQVKIHWATNFEAK